MSQTFNGQAGGMIASLLPQQQAVVYGPDGRSYPSADAARAAGVFDFMYMPPVQLPPAQPVYMQQFAPEMQIPVAAPRGSFQPMPLRGSGLLTEAGSAVLPSNVPMYQNTWKVPDYLAPAAVQRSQAMGLMGNIGGGSDYSDPNPGWTNMSDAEKAAWYAENPTMAAITRAGQAAFGYAFPTLLAVQDYMNPGFGADQRAIASGEGYFSSQGGGSKGESWQNAPADMGITAAPRAGAGYFSDNSIEMGGGGGGSDFSSSYTDAGGGSFDYSADSGYDF